MYQSSSRPSLSKIIKGIFLIIRNLLILIGFYIVAIFLAFLYEYTYKKKSGTEIKEISKGIIFKITILFIVIIIASIIFGLMGIKPE